MKKTLVALALASAFSGAAFAQSSVTIYGLIDTTIHRETHVDAAGDSKLLLDDGAFNGNRLGFKGSEDLGGDTRAIFDIEAGFNLGNGSSEQQGQLFGRQAWVGLSNPTGGSLTLGRQYGTGFNFYGDFDPLGVGNWGSNSWELALTGVRFDNSVVYTNNFGGSPVNVLLQYSIGGQAGNQSSGNTYGGYISGNIAPVKLGAFIQQSKETGNTATPGSLKDSMYGVGATGTFSIVTPFLSYGVSTKDAGFAKAASLSGGPLADSSLSGNSDTVQRKDKLLEAGLGIQATSAVGITLGIMNDKVSRSISYTERTIYGYVTYNLSARTTTYIGIDANHIGNGTAGSLSGIGSGYTSSTDYGIGLRHRF
ncbi:MAG TPA: porin [Burkholderiaceae bacterium]|nr:porin [Burkholderiaceae bacterium]